jgi:hypothetical protein
MSGIWHGTSNVHKQPRERLVEWGRSRRKFRMYNFSYYYKPAIQGFLKIKCIYLDIQHQGLKKLK